jgi:hypothetical protein
MAVLDFEIDKLTNSIESVISGESFDTEIVKISDKSEFANITGRNGWRFDWKKEFDITKSVYKLVVAQSPVIQGLISFSEDDGFLYMNLIETAPHNFGKAKQYRGVAGNLVAFVCMKSFEKGFDGFVCFDAKTQLTEHYEKTLDAFLISSQRMVIATNAAKNLVVRYFPDYKFSK